jgi:hypothetical protein
MAEVRLNLADIVLALTFEDSAVGQLVAGFYRGFLTTDQPDGLIAVDWLGPCDLHWEEPGEFHLPTGELKQREAHFAWDLYSGSYHLDRHMGACHVKGIYGLERFLWAVMSVVIPEWGGLLVHAASVVREGLGYVFPGPSGTGKSTLIDHSPDCPALSDDGTLLRFRDGRLHAYASIFRSDNYRDFCRRSAPVAGIYFLLQDHIDHIFPLSKAEALQLLMPQIFMFLDTPDYRRQCFEVAYQAIRDSRTCLLGLTNSGRFWRCISDEVAGEAGTGVPAAGR